jgi:hypothetical protein
LLFRTRQGCSVDGTGSCLRKRYGVPRDACVTSVCVRRLSAFAAANAGLLESAVHKAERRGGRRHRRGNCRASVSDADIVSLAFGTNALQKLDDAVVGGVFAKGLFLPCAAQGTSPTQLLIHVSSHSREWLNIYARALRIIRAALRTARSGPPQTGTLYRSL